MIFRQVVHDDLGCASYFVGDEQEGLAAVVDPRYEIDEYLELARYLDVRITDIFETHNHADHVSGHGRLAAATGATIHVHRLVAPEFAHEPFDHGDEFALGSLRIRALHTPGHRPEHTCFLLTDTRRGEEPWAVLTGDSLFVGDVARPDLAVERTEGARGIYHSLHDRLLTGRSQVLDVRDPDEYDAGHIPGSLNVPWHDIDGIPDGIDPDQQVLVICASSQRAGTAASLLQRFGARDVVHVVGGGVPTWGRLGGALTEPVSVG